MTKTRILLGLAVMALIQIGGNEAISASATLQALPIAVQSTLIAFLGAFAGAWLARKHFLLPSLALWLCIVVAIVYMLYSVAAPLGQASIPAILKQNSLGFGLSGVATWLGTIAGQHLAHTRHRNAAAST